MTNIVDLARRCKPLFLPFITVLHVSAYSVVRAMCHVNGGWSFSATWGSETP